MSEKWIEIIYTTGDRETFENPCKVSFGDSFLTFENNEKVMICINLEYTIKIGTKGI